MKKEYLNKSSTGFLNNKDIERCNRDTFKQAVFAEIFNRAVHILYVEPVFRKRCNLSWWTVENN